MAPSLTYPKLPRGTVNRYSTRASYDLAAVHGIFNEVPVVHVSFTPDPEEPFPAILPMIAALGSYEHPSAGMDEPMDCYLHGYVSSRIMNLGTKAGEEGQGMPVCVCATIVDGIVLSLTPNSHSYNYRSAVLHGFATVVTDPEEKLWAMEVVTNGVVAGRWDHTRVPPDGAEMSSTRILKVKIVGGSAKVRRGMPHDEKKDMKDENLDRVWTGVLPVYQAYGDLVPSPYNRVPVPEHLQVYSGLNAEKEEFAKSMAQEEDAKSK